MTDFNRLIQVTHNRLNLFYKEEEVAVYINRLNKREREEFVYYIQANSDRQLQGLSREYGLSTLSAMAIPCEARQHELDICGSVLDGWVCNTPSQVYEGFEEYVPLSSFEMTVKNAIEFLGHTSEEQLIAILGHIPYVCPLIFEAGTHLRYIQCIDLKCLEKIIKVLVAEPIPEQALVSSARIKKYLSFKESLPVAQQKLSEEFGDRFEWNLTSRKSK